MTTVRIKTLCWTLGVLLAFGLFAGLIIAAAETDSLSYQLRMLGYSDADIRAIIEGNKRRTEVDQAVKLRLLGYGSAEITALQSSLATVKTQTQRATNPHRSYQSLVRRIARQNGVDPCLVMAVIQAESSFNPTAVSPVNAGGLMQLMPETAAELGVRDRFDPVENITAGTQYLAYCLRRFNDIRLALAAYNAGPNRVDRLKGIPKNPQTRDFIQRVLMYQNEFAIEIGQ